MSLAELLFPNLSSSTLKPLMGNSFDSQQQSNNSPRFDYLMGNDPSNGETSSASYDNSTPLNAVINMLLNQSANMNSTDLYGGPLDGLRVSQYQQQQSDRNRYSGNQNYPYGQQYPSLPNQIFPNSASLDDNFNSWNRVFRLILLSFASTVGTMGAIFIISAITVIDAFQVRGNCFLVSLAFGHLMVTILVLPASAIAIMANWTEDDVDICHFQWIITIACFFVSILSFFFLALDNFYNMRALVKYHNCCTRCRVFFFVIFIWVAAGVLTGMQYYQNWGPEFCSNRRSWPISIDYHPYLLGFLVLCTLVTIIFFTRSLFRYKSYKLQIESTSSSTVQDPATHFILTDGYLLQSNAVVYLISLAMWLPLIVSMVIDPINPVPQQYLDTVWYIALANSCSFSYMYAATNRDFREAFNKLFYYFCCKSHVTFTRKGAAMRRTMAGNESMGLRVHIIPGLNIYAQRKDNANAASYGAVGGGRGFGAGGGGGFGRQGGGFRGFPNLALSG